MMQADLMTLINYDVNTNLQGRRCPEIAGEFESSTAPLQHIATQRYRNYDTHIVVMCCLAHVCTDRLILNTCEWAGFYVQLCMCINSTISVIVLLLPSNLSGGPVRRSFCSHSLDPGTLSNNNSQVGSALEPTAVGDALCCCYCRASGVALFVDESQGRRCQHGLSGVFFYSE